MKKQYIYSAFILTAVLCAGCAKEFENTTNENDSSAIELSSVSTDPMTKAVITGTSFTTDEAAAGIGLFLLDGSDNAYGKNAGNVRYGYSDGKWTATSPLRIGNTEGTLVGYYPYSSTATNVKAIPVASSINGTDYLYGSITEITSAKAKTESLTLSHALTRLRITFKRDASFVGDGILSSLTIEGDGVAASGTLDATSGEITATKSAFTVSGLNASITTGLTEDCLVVPAAASDTPQAVTLKFTVDGKAYKVDLKDGLAVKLQSGVQTDITLTVKNTSVTVDGTSIGTWGDGGSQTVTVGGNYKVTVKLADDTPASEVLSNVYVEDNSVIIEFYSKLNTGLWCSTDEDAVVPVTSASNGFHIFTLSDITDDVVVTVGYINVKYDMNNSGKNGNFTTKPENITKIRYNAAIKEPDRPFSDKYGFRGWYTESTCENPWNFSTGVTKNMTLYAKWTEDPTGTQINGHDFVKLGGYYWATENASGNQPKYKDDLYGCFYSQDPSGGTPALDAAKNWGGEGNFTWTLPSEAQWRALIDYCKWERIEDYKATGMNGHLVKGREDIYEADRSIFLPDTGVYTFAHENRGRCGYYWSSDFKRAFYSNYGNVGMFSSPQDNGRAVRPVLAE